MARTRVTPAMAAMRTIHGTVDTSTPSVSDEGAANNATGDANNATAAANNATGAANNATGAANNTTGAANNTTGAANNTTGAANNAHDENSNEKKYSKKDDASQKDEKVRCEKPPKKRQKSSHSSEN